MIWFETAGCKNFMALAEFSEKPKASKCAKCRWRSRTCYELRREENNQQQKQLQEQQQPQHKPPTPPSRDPIESDPPAAGSSLLVASPSLLEHSSSSAFQWPQSHGNNLTPTAADMFAHYPVSALKSHEKFLGVDPLSEAPWSLPSSDASFASPDGIASSAIFRSSDVNSFRSSNGSHSSPLDLIVHPSDFTPEANAVRRSRSTDSALNLRPDETASRPESAPSSKPASPSSSPPQPEACATAPGKSTSPPRGKAPSTEGKGLHGRAPLPKIPSISTVKFQANDQMTLNSTGISPSHRALLTDSPISASHYDFEFDFSAPWSASPASITRTQSFPLSHGKAANPTSLRLRTPIRGISYKQAGAKDVPSGSLKRPRDGELADDGQITSSAAREQSSDVFGSSAPSSSAEWDPSSPLMQLVHAAAIVPRMSSGDPAAERPSSSSAQEATSNGISI
jgi:hypothetical protein